MNSVNQAVVRVFSDMLAALKHREGGVWLFCYTNTESLAIVRRRFKANPQISFHLRMAQPSADEAALNSWYAQRTRLGPP
jgi:hypothetical protein